jgi:TIR domain/Domain of unknown function (DUF4365)/Ras of Complex, Roc, domain of DAPkinase/WD domain, G-beta repeat
VAEQPFEYDVFLSYSSKDKAIVRDVAAWLRQDGLKVWFDEWVIKAGDSVPAKIEEGLKQSRVLVLCMSANAFGSDWSKLEAGTFQFRDPLNKERRFVPVRLDDAPIEGTLAQFLYIDWLSADRADEYAKLREACRPPAAEGLATGEQIAEKTIQLDYAASIQAYAFSPDGKRAITGADDKTVRLWDLGTGGCLRVFEGHTAEVRSVVWSVDQCRVLSCSNPDPSVRLWDVETGNCVREFRGDTPYVWKVAISPDGHLALHGDAYDLRLWNLETGECQQILETGSNLVTGLVWSDDQHLALAGYSSGAIGVWNLGDGRFLRLLSGHTRDVSSLAVSRDGRHAVSGSGDHTVRLWDVEAGYCERVFEGHTSFVYDVLWYDDERLVVSGSSDRTLRLWEVETGRCLRVFKGHTGPVRTLARSNDRHLAFSGDQVGNIRVWDLSEFVTAPSAPKRRAQVSASAPEQIQYTNAKVLLVGDAGVGKSGLSNYLAHGIKVEDNKPLPSTDGAWATHWPLEHTKKKAGVEREIWLWDFAGQVDYRLVHQLFMDDTAAAVLVFNPQNENPFEGLGHWDRDLQKGSRKPFTKLLAAGRVDCGGLVVSGASMKKFMDERGFLAPLHLTSAKTGDGCDGLRAAIVEAIDWKRIPETTSPALYHRMKQEILNLRDSGLVLIRLAELNQRMEMTLRGEKFELAELEAVISLLAGPGMIQRLDFGGFILLRPEVLSRYAAAVVRKVRKHPQEMGCIREEELLVGDLDYMDFNRLPREDEEVVLRALHETALGHAWCLRQPSDGGTLLTFPSYFRRKRLENPAHPNVLASYRFCGPVDEIYATLVVRLNHTKALNTSDLWKDAADFRTQAGAPLGITLIREGEGRFRLDAWFAPRVSDDARIIFERYIFDHLTEHAHDVKRLRHYACGNSECDAQGQPFADRALIDKALAGPRGKVFCPECGSPITLRDVIEEKFESPAVKKEAREMKEQGQSIIDDESRALILVGHAIAIASEAGQIYRGYADSDHGIDGEIEFKDDDGSASGKRLLLQLKSGNSYLKQRRHDGAEVFQIKNPRWADYWQQQAYPVMLVTRTSDGQIRWMDIRTFLKRESTGGKPVVQVIFEGDPFTVLSVRQWRDSVLTGKKRGT